MTPEQTAVDTAAAISGVASRFMLDPATYAAASELGFDGMDFYAAGRGGALGDVDADVVTAAFVFFNPEAIRSSWAGGRKVMAPSEAAEAWAGAAHTWVEANIPDHLDASRLAELAGQLCQGADAAGAPVFAGWRTLPEPAADRPKALALHRLNGLRELRNGLHGGAVLASGLAPVSALMLRQPYMAGVFGWEEPSPPDEAGRPLWESAEAATNRAFGRTFAILDEAERAEFVELVNALHNALSET